MKIHELNISSTPDRKRVGRGIGSGYGKTAGRGTKGQNARTGGGVRPGFEGGQNPLAKRLPKKRGFAPLSRVEYQVVNLGELDRLNDGAAVDVSVLAGAGLIKHADRRVKLLARGELSKKLTVKVHAASAAAKAAVEKAGGTLELVEAPKTPAKKATRPEKTSEQAAS
ncbi:MAG TPA: 50S ribosomal protein L15 [Candidatus Saccharimonadia bacterium]|jgi:large subunit ribosomal protein L15